MTGLVLLGTRVRYRVLMTSPLSVVFSVVIITTRMEEDIFTTPLFVWILIIMQYNAGIVLIFGSFRFVRFSSVPNHFSPSDSLCRSMSTRVNVLFGVVHVLFSLGHKSGTMNLNFRLKAATKLNKERKFD